MLFSSYIGCIEAVARLGENATVGNIQKMNMHLTVGQVKRVMKYLASEKYVFSETRPYGRTGKNVYYLSNLCVTNLYITSRATEDAGYIPAVEGV